MTGEDPITRAVFDHLVDLAALELDETESEYLRRQLNNQLKAIRELEAVPLPGQTPPSAHGVSYPPEVCPAPRDDVWQPYPDAAELMAQAPAFEDGYIIVPDIPHTRLE